MIPYAIAGMDLDGNSIRLLEITEESALFRLSEALEKERVTVRLSLFLREEKGHTHFDLPSCRIEFLTQEEDGLYYRIYWEDEKIKEPIQLFLKEYMEYVDLRLHEEDARLSQALTSYPAQAEKQYSASFLEQKKQWLKLQDSKWSEEALSKFQMVLNLDAPWKWNAWLRLGSRAYWEAFCRQEGLEDHPLFHCKIDRIYIGNQYCPLLFPKKEEWEQLMKKAEAESLPITVVTSFVTEEAFHATKEFCTWIIGKGVDKMEFLVNDWGLLSLLKESKMRTIAGVLLLKQKKDTRRTYAFGKKDPLEPAFEAPFYKEWLQKDLGVKGVSIEASGEIPHISYEEAAVHFPFYQMNTARVCSLYALNHWGDRGKSGQIRCCQMECKEQAILYPDFLQMTGRYNSVFGCNGALFEQEDWLEQCLEQGVTRLVPEWL